MIEPGQLYRRTKGKRNSNEPGRSISRYLAFFLGIAIIMTFGSYGLKNTILNSKIAVAQVTRPVYVKQATSTLNSVVAALASQNNIPTSLTSGLVTEKQVKKDLAVVTRNIYAGKKQLIKGSLIKKQIGENLEKKASNLGISTENVIYQSIQNTFLSTMSSYITSKISATPAGKLSKVIKNVKKVNNLIFVIGITLLIILSLFLIVHDRNIFRVIHYWGISAIWSGLILVGLTFLISNSEIPDKIANMADEASGLIGSLLQITFSQLQNYGLWIVVVGIILVILGLFKKRLR